MGRSLSRQNATIGLPRRSPPPPKKGNAWPYLPSSRAAMAINCARTRDPWPPLPCIRISFIVFVSPPLRLRLGSMRNLKNVLYSMPLISEDKRQKTEGRMLNLKIGRLICPLSSDLCTYHFNSAETESAAFTTFAASSFSMRPWVIVKMEPVMLMDATTWPPERTGAATQRTPS